MSIVKLITCEEKGEEMKLKGRRVIWKQKPETTGGQYSSVCIVEVEPHVRALPAHSHPNGEETVYIIEGNGKVLIGDEVGEVHPGTLILFPQGVPHMLYNTGSEPLKGVCFYAPSPEAISYEYFEDVDFPEFRKV